MRMRLRNTVQLKLCCPICAKRNCRAKAFDQASELAKKYPAVGAGYFR
jgi:hypothetical protein